MSVNPTIVSYEWCGELYSSAQEAREARDSSDLVSVVGSTLAGQIFRHWSDGVTDTLRNQRTVILSNVSN
jgi:hypothetical protein